MRINEVICGLDFDPKGRTTGWRIDSWQSVWFIERKKHTEVKAKQKVIWKDKHRMC